MRRRSLVIGAAVALAVVVLLLTFLARPGRQAGGGYVPPAPVTTAPPVGLNPDDLANPDGRQPLQSASHYIYRWRNRHDQLIEVTGDKITPKPNGVIDAIRPLARIHLTPQRVLQIRAAEGTFVVPDNRTPRSGALRKDVTVALFEAPPGQAPDLRDESADRRLLLSLPGDARFDLELGQVESDGPVQLVSQRVDFLGTGLRLSYNELHRQIDRLEIPHGQSLTVHSAESAPAPTTAPTGGGAATKPAPASQPAEPPPVYHARLEESVRVQSRDLDLAGQRLDLIFSLGARGDHDSMFRQFTGQPPLPSDPRNGEGRGEGLAASLSPAPKGSATATSPATSPADDLIVTWTGPMVVEPEPNPPAGMALPDDALLTMVGQPVRVVLARQEKVAAAAVEYLVSDARVRVVGSDLHPLVIDSPHLGVLHGQTLVLRQNAGVGQLLGPGDLLARGDALTADTTDKDKAAGDRLPRGLTVAWRERVDLTFYLADRDPKSKSPARLRALRSAEFLGAVKVRQAEDLLRQSDFEVDAQRLALALDDPAQGKQGLKTVQAAGDVWLRTSSAAAQPDVSLKAQQLLVDLARNAEGQFEPRRVRASDPAGVVEVRQAGQFIKARFLDALLHPLATNATQPAGGALALGTGGKGRLTIGQVVAQDNVEAQTADGRLTGAKLVADNDAGHYDLFGTPEQPAAAARASDRLTGPHIILTRADEGVRIPGPGTFQFVSKPEPPAPAKAGDPTPAPLPAVAPTTVNVVWAKDMTFSNTQGTARFRGNVKSTSQRPKDNTELTAGDLEIAFGKAEADDDAAAGQDAAKRDAAKGSAAGGDLFSGARVVKTLVAREHVVFRASKWADQVGGTLENHLLLEASQLRFDNLTEQVEVPGAGQMLVQDHRPKAATTAPAPADATDATRAFFTGRGDTGFAWTGHMLLDAHNNDMTMVDNVFMRHRPLDSKDRMEMRCQRLFADLESTGGLRSLTTGKTTQPRLMAVRADDAISINWAKRSITTDHVQYDGTTETVVLHADPGHETRVDEEGNPAGLTASSIRWHLKDGKLEILDPGPGRVPVGR